MAHEVGVTESRASRSIAELIDNIARADERNEFRCGPTKIATVAEGVRMQ
jgi:hypothetical protein